MRIHSSDVSEWVERHGDVYKEMYTAEVKKHNKVFEPHIKEAILWQMILDIQWALNIDIQRLVEMDVEDMFDDLD